MKQIAPILKTIKQLLKQASDPKFWAIVLVLINICVCIADKEIVGIEWGSFCYLNDDDWRSRYVSRLIDFTWR